VHDASSQNQQFPKNEVRPSEERLSILALRVVILHSLLLAGGPLLQSWTPIAGGWIDAYGLLVVFILGPGLGAFFLRSGQVRLGSILLLAIMPAALYTHSRILWSLFDERAISLDMNVAVVGFGILLIALVACSLAGSLVSFALLRTVHATDASSDTKESA